MSDPDHFLALDGGGIRCGNCGTSHDVYKGRPMLPVWEVTAIWAAFAKQHADCLPPPEPRCTFCHAADHAAEGHVGATTKGPADWPDCGDTGTSSRAIWRHMQGMPPEARRDSTCPLDTADFGRCYRLLAAPWAAMWRARIAEMARYPGWGGLVGAWEELEALYVEERGREREPKLYARMQALAVEPPR